VNRPRITQIRNLNLLASDIQEELLHLPRVTMGKDPITERDVRPIVAETDWARQKGMWRELVREVSPGGRPITWIERTA
jgi:hypothetical protein